ncbi:transposase [Alkalinema pantanalense CENA528]|uniref:transposase n=1 Tax=Alkalinema pantanalense TaxID=1620705 RepID=UPI003D6DCB3A
MTISRLPEVANPARQLYPSDLSDAEWGIIDPKLPTPKGFEHPRKVDLSEMLNAIFYVQRTRGQWEMLPHTLLPHQNGHSSD